MPYGFLVTVSVAAGGTLLALLPLRVGALGGRAFVVRTLVAELPFLLAAWVAASSVLALAQGDVGSTAGRLVLGLAGLTVVGLGILVRRALRTGPAVRAALDDGLGPGWRAGLRPQLAAPLRSGVPWARVLLRPVLVRRRDVERVADVAYGPAGRHHRLDVYRRRDRIGGGPVLVHLHGGHFRGGRKDREARSLLYRLASQGWVCISANYRLQPGARYLDQLVDVKRVLGWVRRHAGEHGGDAGTVVVAGSSAGAHLAATAALTHGDPAYQPGFEDAGTKVAAAVCLYGYYGPADDDPTSSPLVHVGPDAPPFLVVHGDRDTLVAVGMARDLAHRLRRTSRSPVVLAELPGGEHAFDLFHSVRFEHVVNGVEAFLTWVRSQAPVRSPDDHR